MSKHRNPTTRRRVAAPLGAGATALAVTLAGSPLAGADEGEDLLAELEEISHHANEKNEEVKALEDEVEAAKADLDGARDQVAAAQDEEAEAAAQLEERSRAVDEVAGSKYRTASSQSALRTLGSDSPRDALDRASFLNTLSRTATDAVEDYEAAAEDAANKRASAEHGAADIEAKKTELEEKLTELLAERDELKGQAEELQGRIDALDEEQRQAWESRNRGGEPAPAVPSETGNAVIDAALGKIGSPYSWGGNGPDSFDCSGLVFWAHQQAGKTVPRTSSAQIAGGQPVSRADLQPGDIVGYYPGVTHVGIYIGNGQIVHASDYGVPVQIASVDHAPFAGAARY